MKHFAYFFFLTCLGLSFSGCSLKYDLDPPIASKAQYTNSVRERKVVYVKDDRVDKQFTEGWTGLSNVDIQIGNVDDPIAWLAENLDQEFSSHLLNLEVTIEANAEKSADAVLAVKKFKIISERTSGFHPYVAYHSFVGTLTSTDSSQPVLSYFVFGKVPVWSMKEIQKPCFNLPSSILIKEIAAKVNKNALHNRISDCELEELNEYAESQVNALSEDAYLSEKAYMAVLEIGQSNNPAAASYLKDFVESPDILIRACALSALGMIGQEGSLAYLKEQYLKSNDIDRFMALKSIGDIGTPQAMAFLEDVRKEQQYKDDFGIKFVVDMYLEYGR